MMVVRKVVHWVDRKAVPMVASMVVWKEPWWVDVSVVVLEHVKVVMSVVVMVDLKVD